MTQMRWQETVAYIVLAVVFLAAFPRLAYRLRWPTRLGPRGLVPYIAWRTAFLFALRTWAVPYCERMAERQEQAKLELRGQLGREPTDNEVFAQLGFACKR